jgi:hypothetical protein
MIILILLVLLAYVLFSLLPSDVATALYLLILLGTWKIRSFLIGSDDEVIP